MYTLRIIEEVRENQNEPFQQVIENFELGSSYSRIKKGATKEFDQIMADQFPEQDKSEVESLLCSENGWTFFIYSNTPNRVFSYFIMTESGKTFERI